LRNYLRKYEQRDTNFAIVKGISPNSSLGLTEYDDKIISTWNFGRINQMIKKISSAIFFALLFGFLVARVVSAQQPTPSDDQVNSIARQLYCPECGNIPLDVCPSTACAQWRDLIRQKLSDGWNEQQIKDYFVKQYGERVINSTPVASNTGPLSILQILIPTVCILGALAAIGFAIWFWLYPLLLVRKRIIQDSKKQSTNSGMPEEGDSTKDKSLARMEDQVRKR
jgi:cytochrome c-type biogenesis protein CcmH